MVFPTNFWSLLLASRFPTILHLSLLISTPPTPPTNSPHTMSKPRKGLSYVLGDASNSENHILPINALQYSPITQTLYSGGRDGTIKQWNPTGPPSATQRLANSDIFDADPHDVAEQALKLETAILSNPLPSALLSHTYSLAHTHNYNVHFDWVNDIRLINGDRDLVLCLADLSIKLLHVADNLSLATHKFPHVHTDYIKKLAYVPADNFIASAGLDGKVVIWDLNTLVPTQSLQNAATGALPALVYSLAANASSLLATGGPTNTVNLYDRRAPAPSFVRKLVGHQDNVRCLLMNDRFVLLGSSDTTIKLWDLRNFKVYRSFDVHDDAVWALATPHSLLLALSDAFSVFYSGDRGGNVVKTDLTHLSSNLSSDVFTGSETFSSSDLLAIDERVGVLTLVARKSLSVTALCLETTPQSDDEISVFASTSTSLDRYHTPATRQVARYQYLRACVDHQAANDGQIDDLAVDGGLGPENNDLNSDFYDIVSHLSTDTNNLDLQLLFSNNYPLSVHEVAADAVDTSEYTSMFLCAGGGPSTEYVNAFKEPWGAGLKPSTPRQTSEFVDETPVEILLNPIPADQIVPIPYNRQPFDQFQLTPKSIIAKRFFNNKRWMLVLYLNGDIKIWDLFLCQEVKLFASPYSSISKETIEKRTKEMDVLFQEYQTTDTLNNWCEVDIKLGKLFVTMTELSFNNTEIYYDELVEQYPFLALEKAPVHNPKIKVTDDDRFYITRILLNLLFHYYALYEWECDKLLRENIRANKLPLRHPPKLVDEKNVLQKAVTQSTEPADTNGSSSTLKRMRMFTRKSSKTNISLQQQQQQLLLQIQEQAAAAAAASIPAAPSPTILAISSTFNDTSFSLGGDIMDDNHSVAESQRERTQGIAKINLDDSIYRLLLFNKRRYVDRYYAAGQKKVVSSMLNLYLNDPQLCENCADNEDYKPMVSLSHLPANLLIIVFEHSPELGNYRDLCSFHLEDLAKLDYNGPTVNKALVEDLRNYLPKWIGQPVLYDKYPLKESPKIAFQLLEYDYNKAPEDRKIGGKVQRKIKKLPVLESSIKLTSHSMLRVGKILQYLTEKFESKTSEMKDKKLPQQWLALECKGEELTVDMTLQTIKTKIWKSSRDIELRFRRRFDA